MIKKVISTVVIAAALTFGFSAKGLNAEAASYNTKAISVAKSNLGVPYRWGGTSPSGFDCSGLVKYSYGKAGVALPRTAADMFHKGTRSKTLQAGDLVFFAQSKAAKPSHVGIYLGSGKFINASSSKGVSITTLSNPYWKPLYVGAKHI
ncbi:peptidase P60 [Heyndrickxia shackletonii]|uniref:Peptidase P60 n=1 Tax=Heyndrickxia shackletonii TaxID=157838 RepID=A0A0Q3WUW1_9BACI|nr:C40 family peptidase [Heyndrickxia shackletonii]KQL52244.1 peptidase P60 [Heyndrickxia shackletonii]MBB2480822.1 C40 family peptidase [Bacillus sp. APMAM]NEZ00263.1 C40 family peptidase [Heyndrickxia shackletonii]RTZ55806.1 NlpC/P60 family protein [Bacillus sp. SAJ1]